MNSDLSTDPNLNLPVGTFSPFASGAIVARVSRVAPVAKGRRLVLALTTLAMVAAVMAPGAREAVAAEGDSVTLDFARTELEAGHVVLIDVREPQEHAAGVAAGARLLPMRQLDKRMGEIPTDPDKPVLLICNTQNRSSATLRVLRQQGYKNVRFVEGGMSEWVRRGWPLVKPAQ